MYKTTYKSPLGNLTIATDGESLNLLSFENQLGIEAVGSDEFEIFEKVIKWLDDYFNGVEPVTDFKLNPVGTDFRKKVLKILLEIPYGETITYGEIASRISSTMAPQAVGGAVGKNPIAIIIPCHRVMGANGKLTGYAAGIDKKIELLKIENISAFKL